MGPLAVLLTGTGSRVLPGVSWYGWAYSSPSVVSSCDGIIFVGLDLLLGIGGAGLFSAAASGGRGGRGRSVKLGVLVSPAELLLVGVNGLSEC